eukprot:2312210-Amphidinium_carterae.1
MTMLAERSDIDIDEAMAHDQPFVVTTSQCFLKFALKSIVAASLHCGRSRVGLEECPSPEAATARKAAKFWLSLEAIA